MICNERQELIIDILEKQQFVSANYIAQLTGCSVATIRRDFSKLAEDNRLVQIRGGAQAVIKPDVDFDENDSNRIIPSLNERDIVDKKRDIAKSAVALCSDGESIFVGDGEYTQSMAEFMANLSLNILTNCLNLASELTNHSRVQCSLLGGVLNGQKAVIPGKNEEVLIQYYPFGKIFISAPENSSSLSSLESSDKSILQKLRDQADELIVLCESSKLSTNTDLLINSLVNGDVLITDNAVTPSLLSTLRDFGIRCIIADSNQHE